MAEQMEFLITFVFMIALCNLIMVGVIAYELPRHLERVKEIRNMVREMKYDAHDSLKNLSSMEYKLRDPTDVEVNAADFLDAIGRVEKEVRRTRKVVDHGIRSGWGTHR